MFNKPITLLTTLGIVIGLLISLLDSLLHILNFEGTKIANITIFVLFFTLIYWSVSYFKQKIKSGTISYGSAFGNILYIGLVSSIIIAITRFVFLKYFVIYDIDEIIKQAEESLTYGATQNESKDISGKLTFIKFSYDPIVSSILYFAYYSIFVTIFAFFAAFFLKRVNRNI